VVIYVTDNLRKPLNEFYTNEKLNIKTEPYKFEGAEWWFETIINYGNIVVIYVLMTKYKSETNAQSQKKIIIFGVALVLGWLFVLPQFKHARVVVKVKDSPVYSNTAIVPKDIISAIDDESYLGTFEDDTF
jgi:hypothetical protein